MGGLHKDSLLIKQQSAIKNVYYSIQADFSKYYSVTQDVSIGTVYSIMVMLANSKLIKSNL